MIPLPPKNVLGALRAPGRDQLVLACVRDYVITRHSSVAWCWRQVCWDQRLAYVRFQPRSRDVELDLVLTMLPVEPNDEERSALASALGRHRVWLPDYYGHDEFRGPLPYENVDGLGRALTDISESVRDRWRRGSFPEPPWPEVPPISTRERFSPSKTH